MSAGCYGAAAHHHLVPLDYALSSSLVRVKLATSPGTFADDPDIFDPLVALPVPLVSVDPAVAFAWTMPNRSTALKVKLKVTFRDDSGGEVEGTFKASGFVVVPLHAAEAAIGAVRPAIENHQESSGTSGEPLLFEDIGPYDVFGLRLYDIVAPLATRAFIRAEEVL